MAPFDFDDGRVRYKGKIYGSRLVLPDENINGSHIRELKGRGWDRKGYELVIHRDGSIEIITEVNDDNYIEAHEMTWGAAGINQHSKHWMLEGGWSEKEQYGIFDFFEVFTEQQYLALEFRLKKELGRHPNVQVLGHNDVSDKTCPNFNVQKLCRLLPIPEANIYKRDSI
jgi:hypothetical protein